MKNWIYMSFVNEDLPAGERWVGACIVEGNDLEEAAQEAWERGINPGGQIAAVTIPSHMKPKDGDVNRLITDPDEAQNLEFIEV